MSKLKDITGKKFNMLTVISRAPNAPGGVTRWNCICDCGNKAVVRGSNLKNGSVKSCGCLAKKRIKETVTTHGKSKTRLYSIWCRMKDRCYNRNVPSYKDYGARGIRVCEQWKLDFNSFYIWAVSSGYTDFLTIERIDCNKDYCPENCTWIPKSQQAANRRSCVLIEHNGKVQNLSQWCKELNLNYKRVHDRMYACKMSFEEAISKPIMTQKRNKELKEKYG